MSAIEWVTVCESPFSNTYDGGLDLQERVHPTQGPQFRLEMEDCFGPSFWGPLTKEEVAARPCQF